MLELIGSGFQHHVEVPRNPSVILKKYYTCSSKWPVPVGSHLGHGDDRPSKASAPNRKSRISSQHSEMTAEREGEGSASRLPLLFSIKPGPPDNQGKENKAREGLKTAAK